MASIESYFYGEVHKFCFEPFHLLGMLAFLFMYMPTVYKSFMKFFWVEFALRFTSFCFNLELFRFSKFFCCAFTFVLLLRRTRAKSRGGEKPSIKLVSWSACVNTVGTFCTWREKYDPRNMSCVKRGLESMWGWWTWMNLWSCVSGPEWMIYVANYMRMKEKYRPAEVTLESLVEQGVLGA